MNKLLRPFFFALALASLLSSLVFTVGSAAPTLQTTAGNEAVIRFDMLGMTDTLLSGPYGTVSARFGLPANWSFDKGGSLQLIVTANLVTSSAQSVAAGQLIGSNLNLIFDKNDIASIPLLAGSNVTYDVPIPPSALKSPFNDGRHEISLFLDAGNDCRDTSRQTSIVISSTSHVSIPYVEQSPTLDLTTLPRPIFQRDSIFPVNSTLVVPDQPTVQEMQAALTVAASFGRMSAGKMNVSMIPMSQLTPKRRIESQLIFVGKSSVLSLLQGVALPSPLLNNNFAAPGLQKDDGVLQMAVSPWNTGRAMLVVGGNSDAGVLKAAQALSSENIQTIGNRDLALIANVTPITSGNALPQDTRSFRDLGYDVITMNAAGQADTIVPFNMPPGYIATEDSYLDLTFKHSGKFDFSRSGLSVFLNGNLIGITPLSRQTASATTQRIKIPVTALTNSTNELRFEADLAPVGQCSLLDFSTLQLSILPESVLHTRLQPATAGSATVGDMSSYLYPFASDPALSNLAFILSRNNVAAWNTAAQIASQIGRQSLGAPFNFGVAYDGEIPDEFRTNRNLIVVGLPSETKLIAEIHDSLPAPFESGTNVAVIQGQQGSHRFPSDRDLGFLQLLNSPWNSERVILAVVGTTVTGMTQAGNALTNPLLRDQLKGNFVLVNGESLSAADTRTGLGLENLPDAVNIAPQQPVTSSRTAVPQKAAENVVSTEKGWIPPVVIALLVIILIVVVIASLTSKRVA